LIKVIIAGGRDFNDYELLKEKCDYYLQNYSDVEIVCGLAAGADSLGLRYAKERGFKVKEFPADWSLGRGAGHIRNQQMGKYGTHLILFWDGVSKGSASMKKIAEKEGLKIKIVYYETK
jgi:hypothetical protein